MKRKWRSSFLFSSPPKALPKEVSGIPSRARQRCHPNGIAKKGVKVFSRLFWVLTLFLNIPGTAAAQNPSANLQDHQARSGTKSFLAFQDEAQDFPELRIYAEFDHARARPGADVTLQVRCFIPEGWHIYSIMPQDSGGPLPTRMEASSAAHRPHGELRENQPVKEWDEALERLVELHRGQLLLEQDYQIPEETPEGIKDLEGALFFQSCNNRVCVPLRRQIFSAPLEIVH